MVILLSFTFLGCQSSDQPVIFKTSTTYPNDLVQLHRNVVSYILDEFENENQINTLLETLSDQGTWPHIDYPSKTRGAWSPRTHLGNLQDLVRAYQSPSSALYQKKRVSTKIHAALNHWLDNDFTSPNWWHPEIGTPMLLAPILILMENELSEEQKQKGFMILNRSEMGMTGQNKVWLAGNVLLKSLLLHHTDTINMAAVSIQEELVVSLNEGVQPDGSYHQHGPQLQFGNYGLSYIGDMIKWITILRDTPFAFDENRITVLRNYLLDGQQWITWKGQMDISACGRQLFIDSPESKAKSLSGHFKNMEILDPTFSYKYQSANDYTSLSGNKHFWRSDIQIQRSPDYYFSIKMCSERVIGAESCNAENIQGYYMGDGATFLYQTGEEYRNIFPFLDWKKIPGTTVQQDDKTLPVLTARGYRIESDFVGGVSDGKNGIATLDYNRNGLKAHKSWFMFDDKMVCLGTEISSGEGLEVTTSVNQTFLNGPVIVKTGAEEKEMEEGNIKDPKWILHDQVGYSFPEGGSLQLGAPANEGSWNWVARRYPEDRIQNNLFKLWFSHGINPVKAAYIYVLIPGADKSILSQMEDALPFQILNTKHLQEVVTSDGDLAGVVFYMAGASDIFGGLTVSEPCLVMLKKHGNDLEVSVADPTQQLDEIKITMHGIYSGDNAQVENGKTHVTIGLPRQGEAGKTVSFSLKKVSGNL
jgi:chondroitin AC lyase